MRRHLPAWLALFVASFLASHAWSQEPQPGLDHTMYRLPIPGGFAVTPDLVHLIVSQPESAQLLYFDTVREKLARKVDLEFQPGTMALRDNSLFVAGVGSSIIYEIQWTTTKILNQFTIPGDGISHIAIHPKRPLVFVSTTGLEIFAIDLTSGNATKTKATGDHLAVSPDGEALYTGMQPRSTNGVLLITETPNGDIHFIYDRWGIRSVLAKYKISGQQLTLSSSQPNASVNGYRMHLSPDGKRLMMPGGGGWRPPAEGGTGGGYVTAVFDTNNLATKLGQAPHGEAVVYHPVLNMAAISGLGHNLLLCNGNSFKERQKVVFSKGGHGGGHILAFVGKGTKVALYNGANPAANDEGLHFFDVELNKDERSQLTKAYGPLPKPLTIASAANTDDPDSSPSKSDRSKPAMSPSKSPSTARGNVSARSKTPSTTKSRDEQANPEPSVKLPQGVIAMTGFNDTKGINANPKPNSPYPLGIKDAQGGGVEPGWMSAWPNSPNTTFVKDIVGEGDGALHLLPTTNSGRLWKQPLKMPFKIETMVRCPAGGGMQCYIWHQNHSGTGPMWSAMDGKFGALDGDTQGGGSKVIICDCKPDTWYKVKIEVYPAERKWTMAVDDQTTDSKFGFRFRPDEFQGINFLVEGKQEIYLDAIRILELDAK